MRRVVAFLCLRGARQRHPAGLLHADLHRHRPAPGDPRRRRQLVRGRAAHRVAPWPCRCWRGSGTCRAQEVLLISTLVTASPRGASRSRRPSRRSWSRGRSRASTSSGCRWRSRSSTASHGGPTAPPAPGARPASSSGRWKLGVIAGALAAGALVEVLAGMTAGARWSRRSPSPHAGSPSGSASRSRPAAQRRTRGHGAASRSLALGLLLVMAGLILHARSTGPAPCVAVGAGRRRHAGVRAVRAVRAARGRSARRRPHAAGVRPVARAADRLALRRLGARRADPAVDLRPDRPALPATASAPAAGQVSIIIGVYVLALLVGALLYPVVTAPAHAALRCSWAPPCSSRLGYLLFLPFHGSSTQALANMAIAGVGSGRARGGAARRPPRPRPSTGPAWRRA